MKTSGYFNAASHGLPDCAVYKKMQDFLCDEAGIGPEQAVKKWAEQISDVRGSAATAFGGKSNEICFSSTTTTAWLSMLSQMDLAGKRVLVAPHDWGDYNRALMLRGDVTVEVLPELSADAPDLNTWAVRFDDDVAALFVPMVTAVGGLRYPVEGIGALPRPQHMMYAVDGAQALGQMPIDVARIGCDAFVATGRKWLRGPRQVSMAWIKNDGAIKASDLEPADKNIALLLGLGVALELFLEAGADTVQADIMAHSNRLRDWACANTLALAAGTTGSVSFVVDTDKDPDIASALAQAGIIAKLLNVAHFEPQASTTFKTVLRLSPNTYTTDKDVDTLLNILGGLFRR